MYLRYHGGSAPSNVIDFSAPINPCAPPKFVVEEVENATKLGTYLRYPDYSYRKLRAAIAEFYGISPDHIVPLNGAAEAFYLILHAYRPNMVIVLEPTFGDHVLALIALGVPYIALQYVETPYTWFPPLDEVADLAKRIRDSIVIWLSNPNNPTGCVVRKDMLGVLLSSLPRGAILVVDEAFIELSPQCRESLMGIEDDNLIVVRSLTKTLGIPGLRIGFAYISSRRLLQAIDSVRQPWNVNSIASYAIARTLSIHREELYEFLDFSRRVISNELEFLSYELSKLGLVVYRSGAPFILLRHDFMPNPGFRSRLLEKGIAVRDASSFRFLTPRHSRISVRKRDENTLLVKKIREVLESV